MIRSTDLLDIQDRLFAAAAGEMSFERALSHMTGVFGGANSGLFELDRRTGRVPAWVGEGLVIGPQDYVERLHRISPRMHYSLRHAAGHVAHDGLFIDERAMDRHEFYDAIARISRVRHFLGSRVYDEGDVSLFLAINFPLRHGLPERDDVEAFGRIAPSVGRAWRLARRRRASPAHPGASAWAPSHLPWAILALAGDGRVIAMNDSADALVSRKDALGLGDGCLAAREWHAHGALARLVAAALQGVEGAMLIPRTDGRPPLSLQLLPVPIPASRRGDPAQPAVIAYVRDPLADDTGLEGTLRRLYGLSVAERRIATRLAAGEALEAAAASLSISRNTARNHLQSVFAKTGTRRQGELLTRILGLVRG